MRAREAMVLAAARETGFAFAGCAPIVPLPRAGFLRHWLAEGRAGEMGWLGRRTDVRLDPRRQFPWARGIIVVGWPYRPAPPPPGDWRATLRGRIAAYAFGPDYHKTVKARLDALAARLSGPFPDARFLSYVDTGAILEREWAHRAGLGWIGKHTLLLNAERGSWLLLGELVTSLELEGPPLPDDGCAGCRRCVVACPTDALAGDYTMDPRRCLSYLTIEHRSALPRELRPALENWIFGCDLCQEACPWGTGPTAVPGEPWLHPPLPDLLTLDEAGFNARFGGTAVARAKRSGLLRNAAVALGNSGNPDAEPVLAGALTDRDPLVRAHAAWALGRLAGRAGRRALEAARRRDDLPAVRLEIEAALASA